MTEYENVGKDIINSNKEINELKKKKYELEIRLTKGLEQRAYLEEEEKRLEQQHAKVKQSFNREQSLRNKNKNDLKKINSSRSWKLSLPIRKISSLLKGKSNNTIIDEPNKKVLVQDKKKKNNIILLESKLWGGFSTYALKELITLRSSSQTTVNDKIRAAIVLARWYYDHGDYQKAFEQLEYINEIKPLNMPSPERTIMEIKVMKKLGESNLAQRRVWDVLDTRGLMSELCLSMAHLVERDADKMNWYNLIYGKFGYNLLEKIDDTKRLDLENIKTSRTKVESILEKYKISIIIPAYNAAELIHIALESLLNQTLQNLEIIVVDDCSPDNTSEIVEGYVKRDSRVKLIKKEKNEGAYAARNTGLQHVTGDFITIHDGDDWSHSQKLELQLKAILNNPGSVASISYLVRGTKDVTPLNGGSLLSKKFIMMNASSLLISREVFNKLGGWDSVRVAGDTEFHWRIEKVYGKDSVIRVEPKVPLSIALSNEKSLTGTSTTHVKTIRFGLRRTYREAFTWWHKRGNSPEKLYMDPKQINRHFPCPIPNRVIKPEDRNYDVVFIGDFSMKNSKNELEALYSKLRLLNRDVAIFHWPNYEGNPDSSVIDEIFEFIAGNKIDILVPNEEVDANQVVIINPNVLKYSLDSVPIIDATSTYVIDDEKLTEDERNLIEKNLYNTLSLRTQWRTKDLLD